MLARMLQTELQKQECLNAFRPPIEEASPFPSLPPLGWFETLVREALQSPPDVIQWPEMASTYTAITGNSFSNYVLGCLCKGSDPDLSPIDAFAYVMRYNKTNRLFLLDGLDTISPVELWLELILFVPSIPLWKAILRQYRSIELITGNLFLSLTTEDAAEYYVRTWFPEEPYVEEFKGSMSEKPFVLATHNFKRLLDLEP